MGLVSNQIEGNGVATISMSVQPHITATVGTPRAVYLRYPAGNQVGEAGKPIQQRTILNWVLEAAVAMKNPGTMYELPYRWRRFPTEEQPVYSGVSSGARHPQTEAIAESLDRAYRMALEYRDWMAQRVVLEQANPSGYAGVERALQDQVDRISRLIEIMDNDVMDQMREVVNRITTMELRVSGKFV
ncbi:MAG: hypothetical protein ACE5Q6_22135 [Dehalococcoidia bacterium]